jgi:iron complex outermembrane receptor protein
MLSGLPGALLVMAAAVIPISPPGPPTGGTLSGRVTAQDGTPVADARVVLVEAGRSTETDAAGHYAMPALAAGIYSLSVSAIGYAPQVRGIRVATSDLVQDFVLKPSLVELPAIQVTATPTTSDPLTSPQPTAVVQGADLEETQAPSLGETLDRVAGVHSLSTGQGIGKPVIRGLTSNRVLVLDNGQRMETQQWGDEHGPNIETALADRIEVIRGPASVLYGSDALGGVVNVIPKSLPSTAPGEHVFGGEVTAAYVTNGKEPDGALLVDGASGGVGFRATLSGRSSGDVRTPDYTLWNSGNRAVGGTLAIGDRGDWGNVTATFAQRDERISLTDEDPTATPTQRIATSRARLDGLFPIGGSRLELSAGYERNRRREFEDDQTSDVALGLLSQNWSFDAHLHQAPSGNLSGVLGVSAMRTVFDKFGEETLIPNTHLSNLGVFGFEQLHADRWDFSLGARYDYRRLSIQDTAIAGVEDTRSWNSVTGNAGVLFKLAEPAALVLNVGRGFRAPSSFDLFSNGVHEGTVAFERGNPNLRTEKSTNGDLALRVQTTNLAIEVGGFVNWIQDYIYTVPTGTTDPGSGFEIYDVTQGDARLEGFETAARFHPTRWLHLQGTADYVRGTNTSTGEPLPAVPPFRATYEVRLESSHGGVFRDPWLSFGGETNARQTRLDPAEAAFFAQAFGGQGYQSEAYTLVNAGAGFTVGNARTALRVDFSVRNLFDKTYANFLSRIKTNAENPGQGRAVILRLSTAF